MAEENKEYDYVAVIPRWQAEVLGLKDGDIYVYPITGIRAVIRITDHLPIED